MVVLPNRNRASGGSSTMFPRTITFAITFTSWLQRTQGFWAREYGESLIRASDGCGILHSGGRPVVRKGYRIRFGLQGRRWGHGVSLKQEVVQSMKFVRMLAFVMVLTLGLAMVAMGAYTAYVARLWFRAMKAYPAPRAAQ